MRCQQSYMNVVAYWKIHHERLQPYYHAVQISHRVIKQCMIKLLLLTLNDSLLFIGMLCILKIGRLVLLSELIDVNKIYWLSWGSRQIVVGRWVARRVVDNFHTIRSSQRCGSSRCDSRQVQTVNTNIIFSLPFIWQQRVTIKTCQPSKWFPRNSIHTIKVISIY